MATRQEELKAGTLQGAVERLAALRPESEKPAGALIETPIEAAEDAPEELEDEIQEIESQPEEVAPVEEADDLFADDLDEAVETHTLEAPAALSKEGKELFAKLAPELQREVEARIKAAERGATQKVQQVAQKEKEIDELAAQVLKARDEWNQKLQSLDVNIPDPPDPDLADINSDKYDPDQFNVQLARYERAKVAAERNGAERRKLAEENARLEADRQRQTLESHARKIVEYFPSWNDQEKFTAGVQGVHSFLISEGIKPEVASRITDPDMLRISYMAARYKEAKAKARTKAPLRSAGPTGRSRTQPTKTISQARASLKETGSLEDAVAVLSATSKRR